MDLRVAGVLTVLVQKIKSSGHREEIKSMSLRRS